MNLTRRDFLALASAGAVTGLAACSRVATPGNGNQGNENQGQQAESDVDLSEFESLRLDDSAWLHDDDNDVYYQLGLAYCTEPASTSLESLAIFVPGAYFSAEKGSRNTYTCTVDTEATVGGFTAETAPVVLAINTGNLSAQSCPTSYSYSGLGDYMEAGCIYVYPGFRGRSSGYDSGGSNEVFSGGAPWPVVDLKAAVRYLRYNQELLPCDTSRVFAMGFSEGGGVSAVLGTTGGSALYEPYLTQIGAITHDASGNAISDEIFGSASWCPITSYDTADAAYEWMMGQYATDGDRADGTWTALLSSDLATSYAGTLNAMGLLDADGSALTLDETPGVTYGDGTYYTYLTGLVEDAATSFFQSTQFPYTYTPQHITNPGFPGDPGLSSSGSGSEVVSEVTEGATSEAASTSDATAEDSSTAANETDASATDATTSSDGTNTTSTTTTSGTTQVQSVQYETVSDYVGALNSDVRWLTYNQSRGTARITGLGNFSQHVKVATKGVPAFDVPDRSSTANQLFGIDDESTLHFDQEAATLIAENIDSYAEATGWDNSYVTQWGDDVEKVDALDTTVTSRVDMFNPLYFVGGSYEGFGTATVAPHWRINSGLFQSDTSLCTEANLALALSHYDGVSDVAFTPVWGQGHVLAERSGSSTANFLAWVQGCCA